MNNQRIYQSMLVVLVGIILIQLSFVPVTMSLLWASVLCGMYWRLRQKRPHALPKVIQIVFIIIALCSIYLHFQTFWGVDAGVCVLTTCLFAKAMESSRARDFVVVFNFALFVSASLFLHSQAAWVALLVFGLFILCLMGLYRLQQSDYQSTQGKSMSFGQDGWLILKFTVVAIPFFVLLFVFFPRLPPLWSIPIDSQSAVTGINDRMSPGDIAQLSQSSALAFRIVGQIDKLPQRHEMYWRAMVLDDFDGQTWTQRSHSLFPVAVSDIPYEAPSYQYLAADEQQPWIMGLEHSIPLENSFQLYNDGSIRPKRLVKRSSPIALQWMPYQPLPHIGSKASMSFNTTFDAEQNPKAQQLAQTLFQQSAHEPQRYIQNVLEWYQQQKFRYTLQPPQLDGNRIDQFLFNTRQGFCEHYASSFAMLMRYAGIPTRVVVGYQGGHAAPDGQSWEVRQLDAHAWTEVYLNDHWQRIDPTAMIAPQRLASGMQDYMNQEQAIWGGSTQSVWRTQQFKMFKTMRIWLDYMGYQWQSKVVGYDVERQKEWLAKFGLTQSYLYVLVMMLSLIVLLVIFWLVYLYRNQKRLPAYTRCIYRFEKQLPKSLHKAKHETFRSWLYRIAQGHIQEQQVQEIIRLYEKFFFKEQYIKDDFKRFKRLLKDCAFTLKTRQKNLS